MSETQYYYVRLEYDRTYNQWYGFDSDGTSTTISHSTAEDLKRKIPFKIIEMPTHEQARLDKVLSKFEKDTRTIERKVFLEPHDDNYVLIDYDHKTFYLVASNMNYVISLETVESLLNDLSDNK